MGDSDASCSFGGTWGIMLLPVLLEALGILLIPVLLEALGIMLLCGFFEGTFRGTIFLAKVYLLSVFHFWFFLVDCYMVH